MSNQSDLFYFNINNHDIEILVSKINSGDPEYTIEKMIEKGLFPDRAQLVRDHLSSLENDEMIRKREEQKQLWEQQKNRARKQQAIDYCNEIADNQKSLLDIKSDVRNGIITLEQITDNLSETRLSQEIVNKIKYFIQNKKSIEFYLWNDLPPLLPNRTDIYFFGQPASGKSCILANMFSHINKKGLIIENTHSLIGTHYKNTIQYEYDLGFLPERTDASSDGVNYIPFELLDPENLTDQHPLNFIEMSGELFDQAAMGGVSDNNLNAKNYLNNSNRKLLFFVVDYDHHVQDLINPDGNTPQGAKMLNVLTLLDQFGTFKQTDGIYILVSKADLFPSGYDPVDFATDFLYQNYMAFINNCKNIKQKYKSEFDITIYPYSIGNLSLKSSYVYERDDDWASKIVGEIVSKSFYNKPNRGWLSFLK
jgi:Arc/MetJ-type ribon-helix-helix transcriptional regulator